MTLRQLDRRVTTGINARGERDPRMPTRDATRWCSDRALLRTAEAVWDSDTGRTARDRQEQLHREGKIRRSEMKFAATVSLREALGPEWRAEVEGRSMAGLAGTARPTRFSEDARGLACWRMGADDHWYLVTCFPKP